MIAGTDDASIIELSSWVLEQGRTNDDLGAILVRVCERLIGAGVALRRVTLETPTIDPTVAVVSLLWSRDAGLRRLERTPEDAYGAAFRRSPIGYLYARHSLAEQWKLDDPAVIERFPLFGELHAQGVTEYVLRLMPFSQSGVALRGLVLSIATDRPGGFVECELERTERILPALGIVAYRIVLLGVAIETLAAYVGPQSASRVLSGVIRRGDTEIISAALLLADLRGFTALVERAPPTEVVGWLNQHLGCIGDAVAEHGGEVLKFLGDGLLAVFPAERLGADRACGNAVAAALDASARNAELNRRCAMESPVLELSLALHFGEVAYGNIGTARRLDFTVIGPAVNEVSRMEALGKELGRELLLSESVAHRCGRAVLSIGRHPLRGVAGTRELYTVAP